ncbi:MAG: hypothetical protein QHH07_05675 [Sedimentisphaerales bacterium]|nr:hypothetical protein [Sedimentisphaerales bacterium]
MGIRQIIIIASAAVVSFAGAFVAAWITRPAPASGTEPNLAATGLQGIQQASPTGPLSGNQIAEHRQRALAEEQVRTLISQLQGKIREYDQKLQDLDLKRQQVDQVSTQVQEQIKRLEDLKVEVAAAMADLKAQKAQLDKTRLRIEQTEQANLKVLAGTYDKMDPDSAAKLLVSMCKGKSTGSAGRLVSTEDAVKILFYMNDKRRAAVLGSMIQLEPDLAGYLSLRLKQIMED